MSKHTKQTYQLVADVLRAEWYDRPGSPFVIRSIMKRFIERFSEDNPGFDPSRFEAEINPDEGHHIRSSIGDAPRMR